MSNFCKRRYFTSTSILTVGIVFLAGSASAQSSSNSGLDEIIVTATKRGAQSIHDVPIAIQAITGDDLARSGAVEFVDFASRVPSLSYQDLGPGDKKYVIRGVNSTGAATVGSYYDEAIISADNRNDGGGRSADIRLYDLERIEVLKGPQGTLYGANSMSGTIRAITNKPDASQFEGYIASEVSATNEGGTNHNLNGAINLPVIGDKLAVRAVGWKVYNSGFIDSVRIPSGPLKNVNNDDTMGGRLSVRFTPTDNVTLTATATNQTTHSDGSSRFTPEGTSSFTDGGGLFPSIPGGDLVNTDLTRSPWDEELQVYSLTGEFDVANGSVVATSNLFKRDIEFSFDSSPILFFFGVPIPGITFQPQSRKIWSNELRYSSKFEGPFNFVAGGFYSKENSNFDVQVIRSNDFGEPRGPFSRLNSDDALGNPDGNTFFGRFDNNRLQQYAIFGEANFELTPEFVATVGARHFTSNIKSSQETTHPFGGFGPNPEGVLTNENTDKKTTFKFNLSWTPNDDVLVYANAAQGFRTGGLNQANLPFASGIPEGYGSDELWNYEIGTKLILSENRVNLNLTAYLIDWSDIQVRALDATGAFPFTTNAGTAKIEGVEAELVALLNEGVTVSAGASYQNARLTEDQAAPNFGLSGDPIPNVPKFQSSINFDIDRPVNEDFNYVIHADMNYKDGSRTTIAPFSRDSSAVELDSYVLANLRVGLENDDWSVGLFARNLFDNRAQVDAISSSQDPLARITVRPRTFGANVSRRF